ncbi:hypothetical protein FGRMN_7042 [Fusarium graminum]|nr:hypothetical protein FGRMN_7042 [Fusarium graminum]
MVPVPKTRSIPFKSCTYLGSAAFTSTPPLSDIPAIADHGCHQLSPTFHNICASLSSQSEMESGIKECSDFETSSPPPLGAEREACIAINPRGFLLRPPPQPHELCSFITPDDQLFQTIHMGAAVVNSDEWILVIDGLVRRPFALSLEQLKALPQVSVTAFHECYGSPLKPPISNPWRIGNVVWSGVRLSTILKVADPLPGANFVWSEGLDHGKFFQYEADRYQKDLTIDKAHKPEVLVAWKINGELLSEKRGGPVRLVVPGWFEATRTWALYSGAI